MWEALVKRYWQITILRESPENTPYSPLLLIVVSFLFFALIVFQWAIADLKEEFAFGISFLAGLTLLCSYFVYTFVLLKIYRKANRTLQTLTTLLFCHTIIHFLAFPLLIATPLLTGTDFNPGIVLLIAIVYLLLTLLLTAWQFLVTVHIYKSALDLDYLAAVLTSFGLLACNILTVSLWQ